jgi:hypothetical protein
VTEVQLLTICVRCLAGDRGEEGQSSTVGRYGYGLPPDPSQVGDRGQAMAWMLSGGTDWGELQPRQEKRMEAAEK